MQHQKGVEASKEIEILGGVSAAPNGDVSMKEAVIGEKDVDEVRLTQF